MNWLGWHDVRKEYSKYNMLNSKDQISVDQSNTLQFHLIRIPVSNKLLIFGKQTLDVREMNEGSYHSKTGLIDKARKVI